MKINLPTFARHKAIWGVISHMLNLTTSGFLQVYVSVT